MRISSLFNQKKPVISFEIFPPNLDIPIETVYSKLSQFKDLKPDFISVTYGAGGSKKGRTVEIASKLKNDYGIESMAHFTCVGHSANEVDQMMNLMKESNLENILALRGDPPRNMPDFDYSKNAFIYAADLIKHIRKNNDFCIAAAAYAEGHIHSSRMKHDMHYLKHKVDAGVDFLITQLFFDNRIFYDFMDKCISLNINCPITPSIMPVFKEEQFKTIATLCGASIPAKLYIMIEKYGDNPDDLLQAGLEYAAEQIKDLIQNGVDGVHINTMNRPVSTKKILEYSGIR